MGWGDGRVVMFDYRLCTWFEFQICSIWQMLMDQEQQHLGTMVNTAEPRTPESDQLLRVLLCSVILDKFRALSAAHCSTMVAKLFFCLATTFWWKLPTQALGLENDLHIRPGIGGYVLLFVIARLGEPRCNTMGHLPLLPSRIKLQFCGSVYFIYFNKY